MRFFLVLPLLLVGLSGCASLTEDECQTGDWSKIGQADAMAGRSSNRITDHLKACQRYKVAPDQARYLQGYELGLRSYCTIQNGFSVGRRGYSYASICPAETEAGFLGGYSRGKRIHQIELDIASTEYDQRILREKLDRSHRAKKPSDDDYLAPIERSRMELDITRMQRELHQLQRERDKELVDAESYLTLNSPGL